MISRAQWWNSREIAERIVIQGNLILKTPTGLGNGEETSLVDMSLIRDPLEGRALLTGTSLAGALRNYLRNREMGYRKESSFNSIESTLFGFQEEQEGDQSNIIVSDTLGDILQTEIRDGVKIDPRTRTAEEGKKFDLELLEAGTRFPIRFELLLPKDSQQRTKLIRGVVLSLQGLEKGEIRIGARKHRGFGLCHVDEWVVTQYDLTTPTGLVDYMLGSKRDEKHGSNIAKLLGAEMSGVDLDLRSFFAIEAIFTLSGSLLIRSNSTENNAPDVVHLHSHRSGKQVPILSGTSLAGALRARTLRICNTLAKTEKTTTLIGNLFGSDIESSVNSPVASKLITEETEIYIPLNLVQNRLKIDRFTGGALPSALFNEQPVFEQNGTSLQIKILVEQPTNPEIGLLLLLLKDLWTSDLPLGGTASIGRGRIRGEQATLTYKQSSNDQQVWTLKQNAGKLLITGERTRLESYVQQLQEDLQK